MRRRPQLIPWRAAGEVSERQATGDEVVRRMGWVFNNRRERDLTLEEFVSTGDDEVPVYLSIFGLGSPDDAGRTIVEIGCGIGRMTCAFTREFGAVIACDLDAGFLERCHETVGRLGRPQRLTTLHVADGQTLDLPPNSADVAFSYITFQHCDPGDALALSSEAVRVTSPGGRIALNFRGRGGTDPVVLPVAAVVRTAFRVPKVGPWLAGRRFLARLGWQANRLSPDDVIGPLSPLLRDVEVWRNPRGRAVGRGAETKTFEGINKHHYWVVATVR
jgi:SAM-dependent methyltransferase